MAIPAIALGLLTFIDTDGDDLLTRHEFLSIVATYNCFVDEQHAKGIQIISHFLFWMLPCNFAGEGRVDANEALQLEPRES